MVTHGFHGPEELRRLRSRAEQEPAAAAVAAPAASVAARAADPGDTEDDLSGRLQALETGLAELRSLVQRLQATMEAGGRPNQ
jgi:hypothetical protein